MRDCKLTITMGPSKGVCEGCTHAIDLAEAPANTRPVVRLTIGTPEHAEGLADMVLCADCLAELGTMLHVMTEEGAVPGPY